MSDPFVVLGVPRDATEDQIKTAYRKMAREHHPDLNRGADEATRKASEEKLKEINAAYEVLKDPQKRAQAANGGGFEFGGSGPGPGFHGHGPGGFGFDIRDIFERHYEQHFGGGQSRPINRDIATQVVLSLDEAFTGKTINVDIKVPGQPARSIEVKVPPGVDDGTRLRIVGEGERVHTDLPPGNLFVTVRVAEHKSFRRIAQNLMMPFLVNSLNAMLGAEVDIRTIDGSTMRVTIPAGVQPETRLRLGGQGMPLVGAPHLRGDLIIVIQIETPKNLTDEQRDLLRKVIELGNAQAEGSAPAGDASEGDGASA